jgi:hypothetical protein
MKEYKNPVKADHSDASDKSAKSPIAAKGGAKQGGTPVKTGSGAEDKGRPAPTAQKMAGDFENTGGKAKSTSMKSAAPKAQTSDASDKSAKSPISGK